ncbi:MAG: aldolase [Oscillospiraceae bacterium]|jgi:2-dehydro-3-deoxyglucarate aldolase/4-hydroxy-2-oxoheptanedioate aldolase|nr:aldolase [Oscillospiraceae bacterium]
MSSPNPFRRLLEGGRPFLGVHAFLADTRVCELLGGVGFDYVWIDMEHMGTGFRELESHLIAARAAGVASCVRVSWTDVPHIKRALEAGPDAVVFPMINSAEEALSAISACVYPPEGARGFGPFRAIRYGLDDVGEYIRSGHKQTVRILQVESPKSIEAIPDIARTPYMDAFLIGPMDLSGSVGELGHPMEGRTKGLIQLAVDRAHAAGKSVGTSIAAYGQEEIRFWFDNGIDFLSVGSDSGFIVDGARTALARLKEVFGQGYSS